MSDRSTRDLAGNDDRSRDGSIRISGADFVQVFGPEDAPPSIGRSPSADITIGESYVSRRHVTIDHRDGRWWLTDVGSAHGTWLDGEALTASQPLALSATVTLRRSGISEESFVHLSVESSQGDRQTDERDAQTRSDEREAPISCDEGTPVESKVARPFHQTTRVRLAVVAIMILGVIVFAATRESDGGSYIEGRLVSVVATQPDGRRSVSGMVIDGPEGLVLVPISLSDDEAASYDVMLHIGIATYSIAAAEVARGDGFVLVELVGVEQALDLAAALAGLDLLDVSVSESSALDVLTTTSIPGETRRVRLSQKGDVVVVSSSEIWEGPSATVVLDGISLAGIVRNGCSRNDGSVEFELVRLTGLRTMLVDVNRDADPIGPGPLEVFSGEEGVDLSACA